MELSQEDALRLHVLTTECEAIRIDESRMEIRALLDGEERSMRLKPNCRDDVYLRAVRELLSERALNSPGGYPVYISRWTRMGQLDSQRMAALLKLGEPEAVVAVASSQGVDAEIARLAWWCHPTIEVARFLMESPRLDNTEIANDIGRFLLEFLPFEEAAIHVATSTRLLLLRNQLDEAARTGLWRRGQRKTSILLGFIQATPLALHSYVTTLSTGPDAGISADNTSAPELEALEQLGREPLKALLLTIEKVLQKPADQDIVVGCLHGLATPLLPFRPRLNEEFASISQIKHAAGMKPGEHEAPAHKLLHALRFLSLCDEPLVRGFFAQSSSVGTLMRKQLEPILSPVIRMLQRAASRL